ncbi:SMI1/KNR4 family protein [Schlesneria paludicola]|uniref:SMI1/KNR4 family protein n=1 Tax=Schlesneria paludicola TaxID=360056 RepID=UPI00029A23B0|nr:SMI1/KNR4 family protein [Schlesneria paludicola]
MSVKINDSKPQLSKKKLSAVEKRLKIDLPEDYRQFMLTHNGGWPEPSEFKYGDGPYTDSCVDWFLSIYDGEYSNFEEYFEQFKGDEPRMPTELVPIALDPGGNLVCISTHGPNRGKVFFWDHEEEASDGQVPDYRNVYTVANSFTEFLSMLTTL